VRRGGLPRGDPRTAETGVRPLREYGAPAADLTERMPYPVVNTLLDPLFRRGALNYWKSDSSLSCPTPQSRR
jgi:hypothetical protein